MNKNKIMQKFSKRTLKLSQTFPKAILKLFKNPKINPTRFEYHIKLLENNSEIIRIFSNYSKIIPKLFQMIPKLFQIFPKLFLNNSKIIPNLFLNHSKIIPK